MSRWGLTSRKRYRPATRYCVNCVLSVGQCRDLFFSHWCRLPSSRDWTTAIRHSPAFHHISCHGCRQWWTPPIGLSFLGQSSSTSLRSFVCWTGWRLQSELCQVADVEARQRLRSSLSSLIVSRSRLLTVGDRAFPVATELPDLVTSAASVAVFRSRLNKHLFNISCPFLLWLYSACAVTLVALDTIIVLACLSQVLYPATTVI